MDAKTTESDETTLHHADTYGSSDIPMQEPLISTKTYILYTALLMARHSHGDCSVSHLLSFAFGDMAF